MSASGAPTHHFEQQEKECPLCGNKARQFFDSPARVKLCYACKTCGNFTVEASFEYDWTQEERYLLSAYSRRDKGYTHFDLCDFRAMCASVPRYSPTDKADRLLQILGEDTQFLSESVAFEPQVDYPLIVANGFREAQFLIGELIRRKLIEQDTQSHFGPRFTVTMDGWRRIEELRTKGRSLIQCFVAMAFREGTNAVWSEVIEPAVVDAGYRPLRIDRTEHVNRIDDEIIA